MKYPISNISLKGNELKYLEEVVKSGWISSKGPMVQKFELAFAKWNGSAFAVACTNGTTALSLALVALGIGKGDEVLVPEFTFIATATAVENIGAKPVFVDCGCDLNIDPNKIARKITDKTKAIIPVHVNGRPANMLVINKIAEKHKLLVIEDCAEAMGARIGRWKVGNYGNIGCFSLFANKIITSGEGGICVTDDYELYKKMQYFKDMAFDRKKNNYLHQHIGYNWRMTALTAAVALAQLEQVEVFLDKRRHVRDLYDVKIKNLTLPRPEGSVDWLYDIEIPNPAEFVKFMDDWGIQTRPAFRPMSEQPVFLSNYKRLNAYKHAEVGAYLPMHPELTEEDINYITDKVILWKNSQRDTQI